VPVEPKVTAPPAGTRYDRLGRTPRHRWWRPPLALVTALAFWFFLTTVVMVAGAAVAGITDDPLRDDEMFPNATLDLGAALLILAFFIPATLAATRWPWRRPAGSLVSVTFRPRWRWLAVCLGVASAAIAAMYTLVVVLSALTGTPEEAELDLGWVGWDRFLGPALMLLVLAPLQSAGEEFAFRGWLPQLFGAFLRTPIPGLVVSALLFASAHGLGTRWGFADLVLFSLVAGVLTIRTGGLEAAIAIHVMNNLPSFLLAAAAGQLDIDTTAADSPWQLFVTDLVVLPAYAAVILMLARRRRLPTRVPDPAEGGSDPAAQAAPRTAEPPV
jgi:membrane protease YdiL (CAAX protease family)